MLLLIFQIYITYFVFIFEILTSDYVLKKFTFLSTILIYDCKY
jgi:hypothetical protein